MNPAELAALLLRHRLPLTTERAAQEAIAEVLTAAAVPFERERSLGGFGVIDFLVSRIGIEVKIARVSSPREIHRQLVRYARSPEISSLILATGRSVSLPVMEKPTLVVPLGRAWL